MKLYLTCLYLLINLCLFAQSGTITGKVTDNSSGEAVEFVTVYVKGSKNVVETNAKGFYRIEVDADKKITLVFSRTGYEQKSINVKALKEQEERVLNISLKETISDI
ncbi:MAG: carboxypeptidase-like regulatory domain-containing protein, partial [Bacteroidota bacterium]